MKRTALLAGAVALVVVSLAFASYRAEQGSTGQPDWSTPRVTAAPPSTDRPAKPATLVDELVIILGETQSKETFTVTLAVLRKLGKEAKPAIAAILRNADRLCMFKGGLDGDSRGKEMSQEVLEAIDVILDSVNVKSPATAPSSDQRKNKSTSSPARLSPATFTPASPL